jgi:sarcosine oxidase
MKITVVGGGILGLWMAAEATKKGFDVRLFEQYEIGHARGSSHGDTRIFRSAYWEGPEYVALAELSLPLWGWLRSIADQPIIDLTGGYYLGGAGSSLLRGVEASARTYDMPIRKFQARTLVPGCDKKSVAIEEKLAGVVYADNAISALKSFCLEKGVSILENRKYPDDEKDDGPVVVCAGPWLARHPVYSGLMTSNRVYCHWFSYPTPVEIFRKIFLIQGKDGRVLYGMPTQPGIIKIGWHNYPIIPLEPGTAEDGSPREYIEDIKDAITSITEISLHHLKSKGCYFTNSRDENFVVHRRTRTRWIIGGLSGHGFKFAPALANLVVGGIANDDLPPALHAFDPVRFSSDEIISRTHVAAGSLLLGQEWRI